MCDRAVAAAIACPAAELNGMVIEWATMLSDENSAANEPTSVAYSATTSHGAASSDGSQLPEGIP